MEKDHFKSRGNSDYRSRINGGSKGRGNASGSMSYAEFKRNNHNHADSADNAERTYGRHSFGQGRRGVSNDRNSSFDKHKNDNAEQTRFKPWHSRDEHIGGKPYGEKNNGEQRYGYYGERNNAEHNRGKRYGGESDNTRKFGERKFENRDTNRYDKREKRNDFIKQPTYEKSQFVDYSKPMRLNRFLANAGVCSRREADEFIQSGVVSVNGSVVTELGSRVVPDKDKVMFHDQTVSIERRVYILLNKPKDYVTTNEDVHAKNKVLDLIQGACSERVYPVGRLDRNTTGVLLITNDGELTSKLTHPSFNKKKVYQVTLDKDVEDEDVEKITSGITLEDGDIKVDDISFIKEGDRRNVGVEIHSGRNRIVRRIFESLGYKVTKLDRVYFAGLTKKNLPRGKWRFLSEKEVAFLKMNANNPTVNC